ncbi:hypothetical protein, partial [Azospirillum brasilense]
MPYPTVPSPATAILGCEEGPAISRLEVAFIDTALDDWQILKSGTPAHIEVFLIDSRTDGMAAM